jgi:hypothetical protein
MLFVLAIGTQAMASTFDSFNQDIKINKNGTFNVTETVMVNFDEMKHGIFRDIPVSYTTDAGNPFSIKVNVNSVVDENGNPIPYTVGPSGNNLEIKIGDPNTLITGKQEYVISYEVSRALLFLSDQDQLYWNVSTEAWGDLGWPRTASASFRRAVLPDLALALRKIAISLSRIRGLFLATRAHITARF